jgi:hypothetical protein
MPYSDYIKILRNTFGKVAIMSISAPKGDLIRIMNGYFVQYPTQTSIRISDERHIEDNIGRFINHSCSPTLKVDEFQPYLWASKDILSSMPLTINYLKNEKFISAPFVCNDCGQWVPREGGCDYYK